MARILNSQPMQMVITFKKYLTLHIDLKKKAEQEKHINL